MSSEVGVDIIETARIRGVLTRHERRFLDRVYTQWEQAYCRSNILHLSGRWAAKEAVSKVLGLGVRGVGWREIEIKRTPAGQPTVTLHGRAEARRRALGLREPLSVSISHIRDLAVAVAVGLRSARRPRARSPRVSFARWSGPFRPMRGRRRAA